MIGTTSLVVSVLALTVSALTAWATLLRRGTVRMTQPTVVYFGPDAAPKFNGPPPPKIFLRTLLFSTGKRGRMIESMHVKVTRNESVQNFNIWVYGNDRLERGSGLFVGEQGISANHHFLTPKDGGSFSFVAGRYKIELFAKMLGGRTDTALWSHTFDISEEHERAMRDEMSGLYFDWGPDSRSYLPHVEAKTTLTNPEDLVEMLIRPERVDDAGVSPKS